MKGRLLDPQATLYAQPDPTSLAVAQLSEGQELDVTDTTTHNGQRWAAVVLPDERRGYLQGDTRIFRFRNARLVETTDIYSEPSSASPVLGRYPSGTLLLIVGTAVQDGRTWIKVRDGGGKEGFVFEDTRMEDANRPSQAEIAEAIAERNRHVAQRNMIVGGLWCGGGIAVTVVTYTAASGGGTYVVAWGAIIFGAVQFFRGMAKFLD